MHALFAVTVPLLFVIARIVFNTIDVAFDQSPRSPEQQPVKRFKRQAYRPFRHAEAPCVPYGRVGSAIKNHS